MTNWYRGRSIKFKSQMRTGEAVSVIEVNNSKTDQFNANQNHSKTIVKSIFTRILTTGTVFPRQCTIFHKDGLELLFSLRIFVKTFYNVTGINTRGLGLFMKEKLYGTRRQ